MMAVSLRDWL